ncbi:hypothetical protein [Pantoea allii]|uniref:hypothetical protein n=1 Tax=Pantoea allii TaxID=574096 RepID=UPI000A223D7B|nr:hypothetical protein [Pantoea allii]MBW1254195.1 hypothetical protein [Pantoea allii]MBW1263417.1 hypothetical protein [Pantoea allii]MBW1285293.1 hypothetical protein [Pantoea allii]ORM84033.1 hypothetical protein HA38_15935 [Pantoea allii]PBJ98077.1 hypothetical protein CMR03_22495 [Pantoea allii]
MNLSGSVTIEVCHKNGEEVEVFDISASEFGLEESGTRNYDGERAYRGLYIYFNSEYGFDVLAEAEEMNHSITDFDINLRQHSSMYEINIDTDNLYANSTDADVEYNEDDWR